MFLRETNKARWKQLTWLSPGHIQANSMRDLLPRNNSLSVFQVSSCPANRVVVALAAGRDSVPAVDFALFDLKALDVSGISYRKVLGDTPDDLVNDVHYDLYNLSAQQLLLLAKIISKVKQCRIPKREVERLLRQAISAGDVDKARLKPVLLNRLGI